MTKKFNWPVYFITMIILNVVQATIPSPWVGAVEGLVIWGAFRSGMAD